MIDETLVLPLINNDIINCELRGLKNVTTHKHKRCYMIIESVYHYNNSTCFHGKVEIYTGTSVHIKYYYYNVIIKENIHFKNKLYYDYEYDINNNIAYTKYFYKCGKLKSLQRKAQNIQDSWSVTSSITSSKRLKNTVLSIEKYSLYGNLQYACRYSKEVYLVEHYKFCKLTHVVLNFEMSTVTFEIKTKKINYTNNHKIEHNIDKINWLAKDGQTFYNNNRDLLI